MARGVVALALLGACSFQAHNAGSIDATGAHDAPKLDVGDSAGSAAPMAKRKSITIDKSKVGGPLDNFPVYIDLTDADIAASARADGHDIHFTDASGTALPYELESWRVGHLLAWVRLAHLDNTANTTIYVVYGDNAKAVAPDSATTFSTYSAVWHLDDAANATTILDSTGMHAGTPSGLASTAQSAGQLGGSLAFDGTGNQQIAFTNPVVGTGPHAISAWVNQLTDSHTSAIVTLGTNATDKARFVYGSYGGGGVGAGLYNDDWQPSNDLQGAGWTLVHWTYEGTNQRSHLFINGVEVMPTKTFNGQANTTAGTGYIGYAPEPTFGNPTGMLGQLDEVRISTTVRGAAWCSTEFANQNSPATFYAVGAEQLAP